MASAAASSSRHVLVFGGAGFLGSAITKRLLAQGHTVTSISPSGRPFLTPSGHRPAWSSSQSVQWSKGDAFDSETYRPLLTGSGDAAGRLPPVSAVVSTVGILLEGSYKGQDGSIVGTLQALAKGWGLDPGNPLESHKSGMYEKLNRDAALAIGKTWSSVLQSLPSSSTQPPPPFVFISAEDIFRPIIDARYIQTKRQAEQGLEEMSWSLGSKNFPSRRSSSRDVTPDSDGAGLMSEINEEAQPPPTGHRRLYRPVFIRPGVMYHPHTRPLSTLPSALLDLSSAIHSYLPSQAPTPARLLSLASQQPLARLLTLSPLHIDTVAKAVGEAVIRDEVAGVVDTQRIKHLAGWKDVGPGPEAEAREEVAASPPRPASPAWPTQRSSL